MYGGKWVGWVKGLSSGRGEASLGGGGDTISLYLQYGGGSTSTIVNN
tara:strand:+ start:548 stop:688 length:141 start_codon:yes stop_codon:yes gene_type:complete